eukprot:TRINITY_DN19027_c0_g1_i1.p1 TRINITY_DN19027_c0_g1~~TRINITY_DN19027_c0_g1_i1.p1  ORF type:complete len:147 (+),score=14.68 TRINITY_DN19027_c0_g1_i1:452-892(+)
MASITARIPKIMCRTTNYCGRVQCRASIVSTDHYSVLGVRKNASKIEIKRAYRRLARQYHPDVCKDRGSEQKFKQINTAYESIINDHGSFKSELDMEFTIEDVLQSSMLEVVPDIFYTNEWFEDWTSTMSLTQILQQFTRAWMRKF